MKKRLQNKLYDQFPVIFQHKDNKGVPIGLWHIETGNGWFHLIKKLCIQLQQVSKVTGITISAVQVKEKFAVLCFYYDLDYKNFKLHPDESQIWSVIIRAIVGNTSYFSNFTCEECGKCNSEKREFAGIISTYCSSCWKKELKRRQKEKEISIQKIKNSIRKFIKGS